MSKRAGDRLIGTTQNASGTLVMRSQHMGSATVLSQIVQMVAQARRSRAPMQRMAEAVAALAMRRSSASVIGNALRLRRTKLDEIGARP